MEKTVKNYIDNTAKYSNAKLNGAELSEEIFLQVQNMKGVFQKVLDYAKKKNVTIIFC
ncbi:MULTISPECIES: hypothetical protein [unclassified Gilliamella]|uniref:hypothetical protein n=1 Tax=unclassified Gilliamella TaxID=2685620 RepID=UPI002269DB7E|nr:MULTISPECIES: hypothetical protein [unclassified Gilliamella]MCX8585411.1 hypothetical protein [Gilliamella sp. B3562]MCX8685322.1 hypothetical protein [Gilliamella sp. B2864]MCX8594556.1 hypothetical protein [Gilliamella sp. B3367]MCX8662055.1 hypothetical protein [Gilliamella sp. B2911]MCX8670639.1 hypothetical protein [Gilliamella sp. B2785]